MSGRMGRDIVSPEIFFRLLKTFMEAESVDF